MIRNDALTRDAVLVGLAECSSLLDDAAAEATVAPNRVYQDVLEAVARITGAHRASIMVMDDDHDAMVISASLGVPEEVAAETRVAMGEAISGWVAENAEPLLMAPGQDIPGPVREALHLPSISSSLCVPISWGGAVLGVLSLSRIGRAASFEHAHLQFASLVGMHLAHFRSLSLVQRETSERGFFFSRFIESIPSSMLVVDRRLRVIFANRHFLESARRGRDGTIDRRLVEVLPPWLAKYAPMEEKLRQVFRNGNPVDGGDILQVGTGNVYFFRFVPIAAGGIVQQVMLLVDDITERHRLGVEVRTAERHLAGVVQSANDLVASLDVAGCIVTWNPAAERVSGWTLVEAQGRPLWELCRPDDAGSMRKTLMQAPVDLEAGTQEVRFVGPDGRESIVDWSSSPMTDDNGVVTGTVVVGRDLTSYRVLASQLIQAEKMASLGVMAGGIAHELRTPLAVIQVSAQLLLENQHDFELQTMCLRKINASTRRAALIIDNLLKFARSQTEVLTDIEVDALLDETLLLLADQLAIQMVKVRRPPAPAGISVVGSADLLQQVFTNLVLNACTAMPGGGELSIVVRARRGDSVAIAFRDTGIGIPAEDLPHLFDPFFTTRPPGSSSSGLGLSISYRIVEHHAGSIDVSSVVGKGSTFTVKLPAGGG